MKRVGAMLLIIFTMALAACTEDNNLKVSIVNDVDTYALIMSSVRGITLTPKIDGETDKTLVYHWKINNDTEKFQTPEGDKTELINEGEPVLFVGGPEEGLGSSEKLTKRIKVTLTIEEKDTDNVLSKAELTIEDYSGTYKVKK